MPAFPPYPLQETPGAIFDVRRTPSAAGLLSETLRRWPGVLRSISLNHSVCALGPTAHFLVSEHHLGLTSWDERSPYFRLRDVDALIVGLGVGTLQATSLHCVDSLLWQRHPFFASLARPPRTYTFRNAEGATGQHTFVPLRGARVSPESLRPHFPEYRETRFRGVRLFAVPALQLIDTAVDLGRRGITMWVDPDPARFSWGRDALGA